MNELQRTRSPRLRHDLHAMLSSLRSSRYTRIATAYGTLCCTDGAQYSLNILAPKLIWRLALCSLSVQVSCLMVITVHGIVPPSCCMYFHRLHPRKYIQPSRGTNPMHCKNHETTITYTCLSYFLYTVYVKDVENVFKINEGGSLFLLVPVRLGGESLNPIYIPCVQVTVYYIPIS